MRNIVFAIMLFLCLNVSAQTPVDYNLYSKQIKTEIKAKSMMLKAIKKSLKIDANNVELHKKLVYTESELKVLELRLQKVKEAKKMNQRLIKMNEKYDKMKIQLLELKRNVEMLNGEVAS